MRILFWSSTFWPKIGGVEVLASQLLPALQTRGHEFAVIAPRLGHKQEDRPPFDNIAVHRFAFYDQSVLQGIDSLAATRQAICEIKRAFRPDLVHVNAIDVGVFFHLITWHVHPAPMLVTLHGRWNNLTPSKNSLISKTLKRADWVVGCSKDILDYGLEFAPELAGRSSVVYNGIRPASAAAPPLCFDPPTVLCLGRLAPEKGFDIALQAFALFKGCHPSLRILIAGDGEARADLERQAAALGLDNVEFLGWVAPEGVPGLINLTDVVVMPSRQDSFPLVALEAGMMGRPIVATRVGGLPELIEDGETGLLVASENPAELGAAVASLLADPQRAKRFGRAARERILRQFSWDAHVDAYDGLYRKLSARTISGIPTVENQ